MTGESGQAAPAGITQFLRIELRGEFAMDESIPRAEPLNEHGCPTSGSGAIAF